MTINNRETIPEEGQNWHLPCSLIWKKQLTAAILGPFTSPKSNALFNKWFGFFKSQVLTLINSTSRRNEIPSEKRL